MDSGRTPASGLAWLDGLRVKLYADTADVAEMRRLAPLPYIQGFTTNPTLMRRAGVTNYRAWAREVLDAIGNKPVSFEVIAEDEEDMVRQGREIASWGPNVYVKVPINALDWHSLEVPILILMREKVRVNVTCVMTEDQVIDAASLVRKGPSAISIFAGRIADTGVDPERFLYRIKERVRFGPQTELIWASPRQVRDIYEAHAADCDIITLSPALLAKLPLLGKDLTEYSHETVQQFYADARAAGYTL